MFRLAFLATPLALALLCVGAAGAATPGCPAWSDIAAPEVTADTLPRVATALRAGRLDVLAIGSGTVLGARGRPEGSFPDRMVQDLRAAVPGAEIRLVVQGERGMPAAAMLATLRNGLAGKGFGLVLWQTGTVEAVRKVPPEEFARTLEAGTEIVRAADADLLLVDPQYSRMLQAHATLSPYRDAMQQAARHPRVLLFRRFDLIRQWVETGDLDLESATKPDRPKVAAQLNACLGAALAQTVLRASGLAQH